MTKAEFEKLLETAHQDYLNARNDIINRYCIENNPYKVGDIVNDRVGWAKIKKIRYPYYPSFDYCLPCCVYDCVCLTRQMKVDTKKPMREVCQLNIINSITKQKQL